MFCGILPEVGGKTYQMFAEAKQLGAYLDKIEQAMLSHSVSHSIASCKHSTETAFDRASFQMPTLQGQTTQTALDGPYNLTHFTVAARTGQLIIDEQYEQY